MKLSRRRRKPAPETTEPASAAPAAQVLQLRIFSNTDLPARPDGWDSRHSDRPGR